MSDDGYYGGASSPFDEYDEYWDEQAGDVAGDLAEHTLHSPIYFDDPHYALTYEYSDWEYYSDDYFDEDPVLLKKHPQDGGPPIALRGKKRKRGDNEDVPVLNLNDRPALERCIVGTTWRQPSAEPLPVFTQGSGEKVSLLKDWKTMLDDSSKNMRPPQIALPRDESWANDMSLADMGLLGEKGRPNATAGPEAVKPELAEDEEQGEEDLDLDAEDEMSDAEERAMDCAEEQEERQEDDPEHDTKSPPRKRARPMLPPSPPRSKDSSREDPPFVNGEDADNLTTGSKRKRGHDPSQEHEKGQIIQLEESIVTDNVNTISTVKRSKRVVFSAGTEVIPSHSEDKAAIQEVEPGPPPLLTPRTTRSGRRLGK